MNVQPGTQPEHYLALFLVVAVCVFFIMRGRFLEIYILHAIGCLGAIVLGYLNINEIYLWVWWNGGIYVRDVATFLFTGVFVITGGALIIKSEGGD